MVAHMVKGILIWTVGPVYYFVVVISRRAQQVVR